MPELTVVGAVATDVPVMVPLTTGTRNPFIIGIPVFVVEPEVILTALLAVVVVLAIRSVADDLSGKTDPSCGINTVLLGLGLDIKPDTFPSGTLLVLFIVVLSGTITVPVPTLLIFNEIFLS